MPMRRIAEVFSAFLLLGLTSFGGAEEVLRYTLNAFVNPRHFHVELS
jgi:chromate transport protein ChrA